MTIAEQKLEKWLRWMRDRFVLVGGWLWGKAKSRLGLGLCCCWY